MLNVAYPDGRHQFFAYDSHGRLSEEHLDGDAEHVTYAYDSMGRITVTDASGGKAVLSPDEYGRPISGEDALGRDIGLQYDANFNLTSVTDPSGKIYKFDYDSWGNVIAAENPIGQKVALDYDTRFNQVSSLVDGRGNRSTIAYNDSGDLTKLTYPGGSQEPLSYDAAGNPRRGLHPAENHHL